MEVRLLLDGTRLAARCDAAVLDVIVLDLCQWQVVNHLAQALQSGVECHGV